MPKHDPGRHTTPALASMYVAKAVSSEMASFVSGTVRPMYLMSEGKK
eukprot:CAMPEP_0185791316 /NCGR_PEP_ID=MMETSP1174-20130828/158308_1 /TAXON_ID=35687 /ORGANISM="Dictyocha speculum, Strain CCMP1381" /LENGTH=46 /DNA_ID= /DNA_START= /DNA_END= /DNA_ORIENTATION=